MTGPAASNYTNEGVSHGFASHATKVDPPTSTSKGTQTAPSVRSAQADIFVAGSLAVDLSCDHNPNPHATSQSLEMKTSNLAQIQQSLGGVGHNVARAAHLMGADVRLCSAIGDDLAGNAAQEALSATGLSTEAIAVFPQSSGSRTAQYVAVNGVDKDLVVAMADMSILETPSSSSPIITETFDSLWLPQVEQQKPRHVVLDANWPSEYLSTWLSAGKRIDAHVTFEPVSTAKSARLFQVPTSTQWNRPLPLTTFPNASLHLTTPNTFELAAMYQAARTAGLFDREDWWAVVDALGIPHTGARVQMSFATSSQLVDQGIPQQSVQLLPFIPCICTKLGPEGVLVTQIIPAGDSRLTDGDYAPYMLSRSANEAQGVGGVYMRLFPAVEEVSSENVVSVNGVGDTFAGTLVAGLSKRGKGARVEELIDLAQRAAVLTLQSDQSVAPGLGTLRMLL